MKLLKLIIDSLSLTELPLISARFTLADSLALAETIRPKLFKVISDNLAVTDTLALKQIISLLDTLTLADIVSPPKRLLSISDILSLTEAISGPPPTVIAKLIIDTLALAENVFGISYLRVEETLALLEAITNPEIFTKLTPAAYAQLLTDIAEAKADAAEAKRKKASFKL